MQKKVKKVLNNEKKYKNLDKLKQKKINKRQNKKAEKNNYKIEYAKLNIYSTKLLILFF